MDSETKKYEIIFESPPQDERPPREDLEITEEKEEISQEDEEEWFWIPKIEREITYPDENTKQICPILKWLNKKKQLGCKTIEIKKSI